jgi:5-formyltetrahydrofolate cyclo-ligase
MSASMPSGLPSETKAGLRKRLRSARQLIPEPRRAVAHERMAQHLQCLLDELPPKGAVALYASFRDEADPRGVLPFVHPDEVAWPRVVGRDIELALCREADLVPGFRGVLEPPPDRPALGLSQLRMVVVPGVGFDRSGHRLGQGGGHYDRLLERLRASAHPCLIVGLAYAVQVVAELPRETHDQAVDVVITELGPVTDGP